MGEGEIPRLGKRNVVRKGVRRCDRREMGAGQQYGVVERGPRVWRVNGWARESCRGWKRRGGARNGRRRCNWDVARDGLLER
jgi:hypothetical protein